MGHSKLVHYIVKQIKDLLKKKEVDSCNYKFQKTSTGNIKIIDTDTDKSCILYLDEFDKCDILENSENWLKHLNNVVCKIVNYGCDDGFCGKKCKKSIKGTLGPFDNCNVLTCDSPLTVKDKLTGDPIIIPPDNYVDRIIFKRSECHGLLTEGTSLQLCLAELEHPELEKCIDLHEKPGILSDDLNKQQHQNIHVFTEDLSNKRTILIPHFLLVKCGLGKEIRSGSVDVVIDIVEFH